MTIDSIKSELLRQGLDDILGLWWIIDVVSRHIGADPREKSRVMEATLDAIRDLLMSSYAVAGEVSKTDTGVLFVKSWETSPTDTVDRIRREWEGLSAPPNLGDVVWLELTDDGREQARVL